MSSKKESVVRTFNNFKFYTNCSENDLGFSEKKKKKKKKKKNFFG